MRVLLLGGSTEASLLARALAEVQVDAVFSYAGRTTTPLVQPLPMRTGGFGGVDGLIAFVRAEGISHVVDATHPFAAQMSRNAVLACNAAAVPLIALERAPWIAAPGDTWICVPDAATAAAAIGTAPRRVFLAIGRQQLEAFATQPQHHYLLRLVDPPQGPLPLPRADVVVARGPFAAADDTALLQRHAIDIVVAKNAGGQGAEAKIDAARALGLRIVMIDRPTVPDRPVARNVADVMRWLGHPARLGV